MSSTFFLIALIAINVIVSFKGFEDNYFFRKYQFHIGSILKGEQIRMITSGFLHADIAHLAFNMLTLYFFAPVVSGALGNYSFLLIYFASLIFGSMLTLFLHKNDYNYSAIGASGAVTGIIYSAILLDPSLQIFLFFIPIPIPAYLFRAFWRCHWWLYFFYYFASSNTYRKYVYCCYFNHPNYNNGCYGQARKTIIGINFE